MTVRDCGNDITISAQPKRIFAIADDAVNDVAATGGLSLLVGHAVASAEPVYAPATAAAIGKVPLIAGSVSHDTAKISKEAVLALHPDLIVGEPSHGITVDDAKTLGIPFLQTRCSMPGPLPGARLRHNFSNLEADLTVLGKVLGTEAATNASVQRMKSTIAGYSGHDGRTAMAIFIAKNISPGDVGAYGSQSIPNAQFEALGLKNVFGNVDKDFLTPGLETIVNKNPEVLVVLTFPVAGEQTATIEDLKALPGVATMKAVRDGNVLFLPFDYASESPFAVDGMQRIATAFHAT